VAVSCVPLGERRSAGRGRGVKLLSYNIQYGFGADGLYDLSRIARVIDGADIIALQEVERHWRRTGHDDQPAILADLLPGYHWVYGPAFDMDASTVSDGRVINRRRQFGTMILSRLPIVWSRLHLLPMRRTIDPLNTQNAALEGLIRTPTGPIRILSLHLAHIGVDERLEQIGFLTDRHRRAFGEGGPWTGRDDEPARDWTHGEPEPECPAAAIWLGDFNSEPGSAEYRRITGETPYHRAATYWGGFTDAALAAGLRPGSLHTHVKQIEGESRKRQLDHCFVASMLAHRVRRVWVDNDQIASDHHPLWVDIDLETPAVE